MSTTILLVDDHESIRKGLRKLLEEEPENYRVVGEAENGSDAVFLADQLTPDVIVLDLMMPGINGLEVTRIISQAHPQTQVVVFSMYSDDIYVIQAFRNGAIGYVSKDAGPFELLKAVQEAAQGRRYLSPSINKARIEEILFGNQPNE